MAPKNKQAKSASQEQQMQRRAEREKQEMQEYKQKLMPLVSFLKKNKLVFKYARVGQERIEYFRFDEYNKIKESCQQQINKNPKIKELLDGLTTHDFFYLKRPDQMKNIRYPNKLEPVPYSTQPLPKFCCFKFDSSTSNHTKAIIGIVGVLALVLFPVWPYILKYAIWLISLYLLIFLVGLIVFRLVIYMICVVLGFNVWIFPNLLGEAGVIESFKPVFYAERWQRSTFNMIVRLLAFLILGYYSYQVYLDPNMITDHFSTTRQTIDDIHDWGVSKIKNQVKFSQKAITNLDEILNETADVKDQNEEL